MENIKGFKRKLEEIIDDKSKINDILDLIPKGIILPIFYKGDIAVLDNGDVVKITGYDWKNGMYIYYYLIDGNQVYSYEDVFKID
ncbi:MAG: hypothetical protein WDA02_09375 [Saccharofermentanales bacterium]